MAMPGETITLGAAPNCPDCGKRLEFRVCRSAAGWYVGTWCCCGPYSRESCYYGTQTEAEKRLADDTWERR